jgi:hypothetical protein
LLTKKKLASTNWYKKKEFLESPDGEEVHWLAKAMPHSSLNTNARLEGEPREIHREKSKEVPLSGRESRRRITEGDHRRTVGIASESSWSPIWNIRSLHFQDLLTNFWTLDLFFNEILGRDAKKWDGDFWIRSECNVASGDQSLVSSREMRVVLMTIQNEDAPDNGAEGPEGDAWGDESCWFIAVRKMVAKSFFVERMMWLCVWYVLLQIVVPGWGTITSLLGLV